MYGLEVRNCILDLSDALKDKYGSFLKNYSELKSYEVFKNGSYLGSFLHICYNNNRNTYIYLSDKLNHLHTEERLALRVLAEECN